MPGSDPGRTVRARVRPWQMGFCQGRDSGSCILPGSRLWQLRFARVATLAVVVLPGSDPGGWRSAKVRPWQCTVRAWFLALMWSQNRPFGVMLCALNAHVVGPNLPGGALFWVCFTPVLVKMTCLLYSNTCILQQNGCKTVCFTPVFGQNDVFDVLKYVRFAAKRLQNHRCWP